MFYNKIPKSWWVSFGVPHPVYLETLPMWVDDKNHLNGYWPCLLYLLFKEQSGQIAVYCKLLERSLHTYVSLHWIAGFANCPIRELDYKAGVLLEPKTIHI